MTNFTTADAFQALIDRMTDLARDAQLQSDARHAAVERAERAEHEASVLRASGYTPEVVRQLTEALVQGLASGRWIEAIKAHRALTGFGLKESKDAIDRCRNPAQPEVAA
jgi:ribosomal protein L7/L12